jgi:hypothetical protein
MTSSSERAGDVRPVDIAKMPAFKVSAGEQGAVRFPSSQSYA